MITKNLTLYEKSNSIENIDIAISDSAKRLYKKLLACNDNAKERQSAVNKFCSELCNCFNINKKNIVEMRVVNTPQDSKTVNGVCVKKTLGKYVYPQNMIIIFNKTAVRKQTVSIRVFSDTVLHEFVHYIDHYYYNFSTSPHTSGFYKRIFNLKEKLAA
jgi:hypothetical protein